MAIPLKGLSIKELSAFGKIKRETLNGQVLIHEGKLPLRLTSQKTPVFFDSLVIGICTKGSLTLSINSKKIEVKEGDFVSIIPQTTIQSINSDNCEGSFLCLGKEILSLSTIKMNRFISIINKFHNKDLYHLEPKQCDYIISIFQLIKDTLECDSRNKKEMIIHIIFLLFFFLDDILSNDLSQIVHQTRAEKICSNFLILVSKYHKEEHQVKFYADKLCVSPKHLALTVKSVIGQSASKIINSFIILQAKTQLRYTDKTIQEIGYELNFSSQSFFGKYFKQHTGMSPGEYRSMGDLSLSD